MKIYHDETFHYDWQATWLFVIALCLFFQTAGSIGTCLYVIQKLTIMQDNGAEFKRGQMFARTNAFYFIRKYNKPLSLKYLKSGGKI